MEARISVATSEHRKRRIVVDYSQIINRCTHLDTDPLPRIDGIINKTFSYWMYSTLDLRSAYQQISIKESEKKFTAFEACGALYQCCGIPFGATNDLARFQRETEKIIQDENLKRTLAHLDNITVCEVTEEKHNSNLKEALRRHSIPNNMITKLQNFRQNCTALINFNLCVV